MVGTQLRSRGIRNERVLAAMGGIPREAFVPEHERHDAYGDHPIRIGLGQTISQPWIVARMVELLDPREGDRVLDVGTGSGYGAAILAHMGCRVSSIERDPTLAAGARDVLASLGFGDQVEVTVGDGSLGLPNGAPWDGILVAAAAPAVPDSLRLQLADGGRLVIPVGSRHHQQLLVVTRRGEAFEERSEEPCVFVRLVGAEGWPD
jgi:protein-L-isoaspartate(D-aspartate) O-methyltransferase